MKTHYELMNLSDNEFNKEFEDFLNKKAQEFALNIERARLYEVLNCLEHYIFSAPPLPCGDNLYVSRNPLDPNDLSFDQIDARRALIYLIKYHKEHLEKENEPRD
jgi:hypothetical protein